MKKFFSSSGSGDHQSSFVGKTFVVGGCQCVVEEVIAEGKKVFPFRFHFFVAYVWFLSEVASTV